MKRTAFALLGLLLCVPLAHAIVARRPDPTPCPSAAKLAPLVATALQVDAKQKVTVAKCLTGSFPMNAWAVAATVGKDLHLVVLDSRGVLAAQAAPPAGATFESLETKDIDEDGALEIVLRTRLTAGGVASRTTTIYSASLGDLLDVVTQYDDTKAVGAKKATICKAAVKFDTAGKVVVTSTKAAGPDAKTKCAATTDYRLANGAIGPITADGSSPDGNGGGGGNMTPAEETEALAIMTKAGDDVCKCKDQTCLQNVLTDIQPKLQKFEGKQPSPATMKKADEISKKMQACVMKIMSPSAQTGDPDPLNGKFTLDDATAGLPKGKTLVAKITTAQGVITCQLRPDLAPQTVASFVGLARGVRPWQDPDTGKWVKKPLFDGTAFHRVIPGFMIQGGDPLSRAYSNSSSIGTGGPGYSVPDEFQNTVKFDTPGRLAMAHSDMPDSGGSQFFITDGKPTYLDGQYTIFGQCDAPDVVHAIAGAKLADPAELNRPATAITMKVEISRK